MIRRALPDDANRIAEIHVNGWRYAYRGLISDEHLFKNMNIVKGAARFREAIEEHSEETYVYEENGILKAFMTIGNSRDKDKESAYELWGLYVDPLMCRKGIGNSLIHYFEDKAKELGYKNVVLWVLEENNIGINFYRKMGYLPEGTKKFLEKFNTNEVRYYKDI